MNWLEGRALNAKESCLLGENGLNFFLLFICEETFVIQTWKYVKNRHERDGARRIDIMFLFPLEAHSQRLEGIGYAKLCVITQQPRKANLIQ